MGGCRQFSHAFIWSRVHDLWWFSRWIRETNSECALNVVPILEKVLWKPSKWFNKPLGAKSWVVRRCFNGMVQDWSHISWQWRTHRETHKLHKPWNCCMNSSARPLGSMSDHSQHYWGGWNWLWDMPTGSDERSGHALCRSQICAQDPDSWPEAPSISGKTQNGCHLPPTLIPRFGTLWLLPISKHEI
jgi:hypothetical protein